jgi:hypothetical protein
MAVSERPNSMKEGDQLENDLKAKWVDIELYLNNGLWNRLLPADDAPKK